MTGKSCIIITGAFLATSLFTGCIEDTPSPITVPSHTEFDASNFLLKENNSIKKVRGQVLYLPIYSNVPYFEHDKSYDLSAFIAIHNTDLFNTMKITKVLFFDNDGKLVADYLEKETILLPLAATNYFVPEKDNSGTGANFIVEWVSDSLINEPLIESVMVGLKFNQGVSFLSSGRIMREITN